MSKPIPDKVLRVFANGPYAGDSRAWHDAAYEIEKIDLARELLALREAARRVAGEYDIAELIDAISEMRDLLPKEAP